MSTKETTTQVIEITAENVTGTRSMSFSVDPSLRVEDLTGTIVEAMMLPDTTAYALRDDGSSRYLRDDNRIGDEISPGTRTRVTVTPKTHLG